MEKLQELNQEEMVNINGGDNGGENGGFGSVGDRIPTYTR